MIIDGKVDEYPEAAFNLVGTIEEAIEKGKKLGGAAISSLHVLALSNAGAASAKDIVELANFVRERVRENFGITLEAEVQLVGLELNS